MVNGNYVLYGDRPSSESEIVSDHVQTRTAERKNKRKSNRNANDLQRTLNMAQLDNDTDSIKYEKSVKEPRLLRYVPNSEIKENYVTEKFETYDLKPSEELPRRYTFQKKPKNPADGSVNYAYSRSSSSCSSPNTNLPTISEHGEQYGTYRVQSLQNCAVGDILNGYEKKMDKYFTKPKEFKNYSNKARYEGSHPDSLYRVQPTASSNMDKMARVLRMMRWPLALITVCIALGLFVYFLMPDHIDSGETVNSTQWDQPAAHIHNGHSGNNHHGSPPKLHTHSKKTEPINSPGMQPPEIDFYEDVSEINIEDETLKEANAQRVLPIKPVYPDHVAPEVQYGNEKADTNKLRTPKILEEINVVPDESTLKPHTTVKVSTPAVYFKDLNEAPTTETITRAEIANTFADYRDKQTTQTKKNYIVKDEFVTLPDDFINNDKPSVTEAITRADTEKTTTDFEDKTTTGAYYNDPRASIYDISTNKRPLIGIKLPEPPKNLYDFATVNEETKNVYNAPAANFTSGHSNLFGIGIEDAEKMRSSTQSSLYNTRVSPTLPTWRDGSDATTINYSSNVNNEAQCRSTHLPLCRGVLPYDLAGSPVIIDGYEATAYAKQFNYLVASNCSERTRQFVCALLEPECNPAPYPPKMPCYNLCKSVADTCYAYIPKELDPIFSCGRYSREECIGARGPCGARETACADGSCILRDWVCDGRPDCSNAEDELQCSSCQSNEFRCASGGCIQTRWLCDGYADCPRGEDELGCAPTAPEPHDEPGSQAAPSVTRAHRVLPPPTHTDESKEILMTSDTNNGLRRNFTRNRPSKSRLAPYTRPTTTTPAIDTMDGKYTDEGIMADLGWYEDLSKKDVPDNKDKEVKPLPRKPQKVRPQARGRAPSPPVQPIARPEQPVKPTRLDKSINNLEKVLDGAAMMRQAAAEEQAQMGTDSMEMNSTAIDKNEEMLSDGVIARPNERYTGRDSAHRSPCPSGELRCVDGRCITLAQLCDGTIDCTDHADEDNCYT